MSKEFHGNLIKEIAKPLWDQMIRENPSVFQIGNNNELVLHNQLEEFTFDDFVDEIRLELQNSDARN